MASSDYTDDDDTTRSPATIASWVSARSPPSPATAPKRVAPSVGEPGSLKVTTGKWRAGDKCEVKHKGVWEKGVVHEDQENLDTGVRPPHSIPFWRPAKR